jgi:NTE family protein
MADLQLEHQDVDPSAPPRPPLHGIALCLSGGGYRAMVFHLGSLWRLNELGLLNQVRRVSSVSGGSITAATLGLNWAKLDFDERGVARGYQEQVVAPVRRMAGQSIDVGSVLKGLLDPFHSIADKVAAAYRSQLFGEATLQDLPADDAGPRFVLNAVNVQTATLWRFSRPYMGDYQVGLIPHPKLSLASAVGASSAFPPYLSPVQLDVNPHDFDPATRGLLYTAPYHTHAVLSDGGAYDNFGLEPAFKRFDTILVSDGGAKVAPDPDPAGDWARHSYRMIDVIDNQVRSLRVRDLLTAYQDKSGNPLTARHGAYWGIRTNIKNYGLDDALTTQFPHAQTLELAHIPTRLERMDDELQERLINWGYAVCDAAVRRHYLPPAPPLPLPSLPYPQ